MTERRYQSHTYEREVTANILERCDISGQPAVKLDRTIFYPTSGGQMHDTGTIDDVQVLDVIQDGDVIWHILEKPIVQDEVMTRLNWQRRFDFMQQHTGFHLLAGAFKRQMGIETLSSHLGENMSTIDIEASAVSNEDVIQVENLTNQIIWEDRLVSSQRVTADEAADLPIRKAPAVHGPIRLIEIKDFDLDPCGGTHVNSTGQVGLVKIIGRERVRKNMRFTFCAGARALRHYQEYHQAISSWMNIFTTDLSGIGASILGIVDENKKLTKQVQKLSQQNAEYQLVDICKRVVETGIVAHVFEEIDLEGLRNIARMSTAKQPGTYILGGMGERSSVIMTTSEKDLDLRIVFKETMALLGGKGGGDPRFVQGSAPANNKLLTILESATRRILQL